MKLKLFVLAACMLLAAPTQSGADTLTFDDLPAQYYVSDFVYKGLRFSTPLKVTPYLGAHPSAPHVAIGTVQDAWFRAADNKPFFVNDLWVGSYALDPRHGEIVLTLPDRTEERRPFVLSPYQQTHITINRRVIAVTFPSRYNYPPNSDSSEIKHLLLPDHYQPGAVTLDNIRINEIAPNDFDGDGKTDLTVWRPSTGVWYEVKSSDGSAVSRQWGAGYSPYDDVPVAGDYDGDGKTDIAVWRNSTGAWYILRSSDGGVTTRQWGMGTAPYLDVPVPGDYDGDGQADIAVWRASTGVWYIIRSSDGGVINRQWGAGYSPYLDVPVPADYDGDGKTDIAVWRPSTGVWYISRSSDSGVTARQWGAGYSPYLDVPVPGDYDADGKTDIAVWRSAMGTWVIIRSSDSNVTTGQWGACYSPYLDVPVPGDYDGDRKTDIAVWRPSTGTWLIIRSSDGSLATRQWGASNDIPIARSPGQ